MTLDSTKIESIKDYFKTRPVLKAYLFGSYVRGVADNKSDIDILVDLDYSQKIGLQFIKPFTFPGSTEELMLYSTTNQL